MNHVHGIHVRRKDDEYVIHAPKKLEGVVLQTLDLVNGCKIDDDITFMKIILSQSDFDHLTAQVPDKEFVERCIVGDDLEAVTSSLRLWCVLYTREWPNGDVFPGALLLWAPTTDPDEVMTTARSSISSIGPYIERIFPCPTLMENARYTDDC